MNNDFVGTQLASLVGVDLTLNEVSVLSNIDLSVNFGEVVGLVGSNGAGKSSIANVLCGYYRPTSGKVLLGGQDMTFRSPTKFANMGVRRSFQSVSYIKGLSISELVMLGAESTWSASFTTSYLLTRRSRTVEKKTREEALDLLESIGLAEFSDRPVEDCPYGVRKFADVARAFMTSASTIVILDEPTSGIGEPERQILGKMINDLRKVRSIGSLLVVDHDIGFIRTLCSRVVVLEEGRVLADGLSKDVFDDRRVIASFVGSKTR